MKMKLFLILVPFFFTIGCATYRENKVLEKIDEQYSKSNCTGLFEIAETVYHLDGKNSSLTAMKIGCMAFHLNQYEEAEKWFNKAYSISFDPGMKHLATLGTLVTFEFVKEYKGWPHERAMICFYHSLLNYRKKNWFGALAYARQGLVEDQMTRPVQEEYSKTDPEKYKYDFASFYYLASKACEHISEENLPGSKSGIIENWNAKFTEYSKEKELEIISPELTIGNTGSLFLVVLDGNGPRKDRAGFQSAISRPTNMENNPAYYIRVLLDGQEAGLLKYCTDVYTQAEKHHPYTNKIIQYTKAGVKLLLFTGGVVCFGLPGMLAGELMRSEADIRANDKLPNRIFLTTIKAPPGIYTLDIEFLNRKKRVLSQQVWHGVNFFEDINKEQMICVKR